MRSRSLGDSDHLVFQPLGTNQSLATFLRVCVLLVASVFFPDRMRNYTQIVILCI